MRLHGLVQVALLFLGEMGLQARMGSGVSSGGAELAGTSGASGDEGGLDGISGDEGGMNGTSGDKGGLRHELQLNKFGDVCWSGRQA